MNTGPFLRSELLVAWLVVVAAGCAPKGSPVELGRLRFVRDGIVVEGATAEFGRALGRNRTFVERKWIPGERVSLGAIGGVAPRRADCVPLFSVELGDLSRHVSMGGESPDTALAFSPDESLLALGSFRGEVLVVDAWSGAVIARRKLAETMVKSIAWSRDGATLYAGEQSPDAMLRALDPTTLSDRWVFRLADEIESSPAPSGDEVYGVYTLPAAYDLQVLRGGDLLVTGTHGWNDSRGLRRNRTRVWRLSPTGKVLAAWPAAGPTEAVTFHPRIDEDGGRVVLSVQRSAPEAGAEALAAGTLLLLDLTTLTQVGRLEMEPLLPYFAQTFLWESIDVDVSRDVVLAGAGDGRIRLFHLGGVPNRDIALSTPVLAGDVPISASVGFAFLHGDSIVSETSGTTIPWGAAAPEARPPSVHPSENAVFVHGFDGNLRWTWRGAQRVNGLVLGGDGETLVVGAGARSTDAREDLFGALIFRLDGEGSGEERLKAVCTTEGPTFFRPTMSRDGRVAVAEYPFARADGTVGAAYRLTVFR